jgi:hypothetical protein
MTHIVAMNFINRKLLSLIKPKIKIIKTCRRAAAGRIILRGIFRKWEGVVGTGWSGLRIGTGGGHL